jgi:hypothetical protein
MNERAYIAKIILTRNEISSYTLATLLEFVDINNQTCYSNN